MRHRTISKLQRLRAQLDEEMPQKTRNATLVLGTWNIRNFDDNRFMNGHRTTEDLYYLAEIISRFDVLAVQEICDDLGPFSKLMKFVGREYEYIITDVTMGRGGNQERLGFIFDTNKVKFKGQSGELVLSGNKRILYEGQRQQFSRTPFMCSFQAGWFKFLFSTVHIYFGAASGKKYEKRVAEIDTVAKHLAERAKKDDENHILVGDFNIVEPGSDGYNALQKHGFEVYDNNKGSNQDETKFYDQISFLTREDELRFAKSNRNKGVLNFFKSLYLESDFPSYKSDLKSTIRAKIKKLRQEILEEEARFERARSQNSKDKILETIAGKNEEIQGWEEHLVDDAKLKQYYLKKWRTFRGSDHYPLWVELEIDFSDRYLAGLKKD